MNIERLPSGSYRIRFQQNGVRRSIVTKEKPTKTEIAQLIADATESDIEPNTFKFYATKYIDSKENVLSPSTINKYRHMIDYFTSDFLNTRLDKLNQEKIQIEINQYAATHSPKSTRNLNGFISAVLGMYRPKFVYKVTLPQKVKNKEYLPTVEDVKNILEASKGSDFEVALWLAVFGLRRSEILALTLDDLSEDNHLYINKALVKSTEGMVVKTTKTLASTRTLILPPILADKIRKQGFVHRGGQNALLRYLNKLQDSLNIPRFKLHTLRHFFASLLSKYYPEQDVMALGGWSTPNVMKSVYRESMLNDEDKSKILIGVHDLLQ